MKTFVQFLKESSADNKEMPQEMKFTLDFKDLPNEEEQMKQLEEQASDSDLQIEIDEKIMTITLTRSQCDNGEVDSLYNMLDEYVKIIRRDQQNSSRESFAQMTKRFKIEVEKMKEFIDFVPEEPKDDEE